MSKSFEFIKSHPVAFGLLFVGILFLIIFSMRKSNSGGATMVMGGPSDAQIAAQTQLGMAQVVANSQNSQIAAQSQAATEIAKAQAAAVVAVASTAAARDMNLAVTAADVTKADIGAKQSVTMRALDVQQAANATTGGLLAQQQANDFNLRNTLLTNNYWLSVNGHPTVN